MRAAGAQGAHQHSMRHRYGGKKSSSTTKTDGSSAAVEPQSVSRAAAARGKRAALRVNGATARRRFAAGRTQRFCHAGAEDTRPRTARCGQPAKPRRPGAPLPLGCWDKAEVPTSRTRPQRYAPLPWAGAAGVWARARAAVAMASCMNAEACAGARGGDVEDSVTSTPSSDKPQRVCSITNIFESCAARDPGASTSAVGESGVAFRIITADAPAAAPASPEAAQVRGVAKGLSSRTDPAALWR
jgi:hypothetical protein